MGTTFDVYRGVVEAIGDLTAAAVITSPEDYISPYNDSHSMPVSTVTDTPEAVKIEILRQQSFNSGAGNIYQYQTNGAPPAGRFNELGTTASAASSEPIVDVAQGYHAQIDCGYMESESIYDWAYTYMWDRLRVSTRLGEPGVLESTYVKGLGTGDPRYLDTTNKYCNARLM